MHEKLLAIALTALPVLAAHAQVPAATLHHVALGRLPFPRTNADGSAIPAIAFLSTIGINGAANATTAVQLSYLGISHLRTAGSAGDLLAAGANGAKIDFIFPWYMHAINNETLAATFASTIDPAASVIEAIEGPNEVNTDPDIFDGIEGALGIEAEQRSIFSMTKANPKLPGVRVYNFSVLQGTPVGTYNNMSAFADFNNIHAYGAAGVPPSWILPFEVAHNTIADRTRTVITEIGANTLAGSGVSEELQARFFIAALLDAWQLGVERTYLYNLQDWAFGANKTNFSAHFGLYKTDGTIKLAGTAIHNFISILSAHGPADVRTTALAYTLSGLPYYGNQQTFVQAGGVTDFVLWNETKQWDATANVEIAVQVAPITLKLLANVLADVSVFDPLLGSVPIRTVNNVSIITVELGGNPLIIEVRNAHVAQSGVEQLRDPTRLP